jgi:hypothetical protein
MTDFFNDFKRDIELLHTFLDYTNCILKYFHLKMDVYPHHTAQKNLKPKLSFKKVC